MKLIFFKMTTIITVTIVCICFMSCSSDDNDNDKGLSGYFTDLSYVANQYDFEEINEAIYNNELLSSYTYGGQTHNYFASRDLFIASDGMFTDYQAQLGRLRFSIASQITVIRIVDNNTLYIYYADLYEEGCGNGDTVYKLYAGPIFGNMIYCGVPTIYTYTIVDNKLVVSNGDIYTISGNTIRKDGNSSILTKYNLEEIH